MAEDNPPNPQSGENDPNHDPFDMLNGGSIPPPPPPAKEETKEETPAAGGGDPFDMVEKHDLVPQPIPAPPALSGGGDPFDIVERHDPVPQPIPTPPTSSGGGDPFDMVERHDLVPSSIPPPPGTPIPYPATTPTNQPGLPNPLEDPLAGSSPPPPQSIPGTIPPPVSIPMPTPLATPIPTQTAPATTTKSEKRREERESFESKLDLDAVIAAANRANRVPEMDTSSMEQLDDLLFSNRERIKSGPEEKKEAQSKLTYLVGKIKKDLAFYRKKERKSGRGTLAFSVLSSLLAASVTVLLGLNVTTWMRNNNFDWYINTIALIISAFISVIGVIQNFTDSKPLWVKYTDTANQYQQLLDNIEYMQLAGDYITLDDVNQLKLSYNRIKEGTHDYIIQVRSQEDGGGNSSILKR